MRRRFLHVAIGLLLLLGATSRGADVIDSVIATVNGVPLLQSDLDEAVRFEALLRHESVRNLTAEERSQAFERLIDAEVLRQQIPAAFDVPEADVANYTSEIRLQFKNADTEAGWKKILADYGLSERVAASHVKQQLLVLRFLDVRLRPAIHVDQDEVSTYYQEQLVPRLKKLGAQVDPLASVSGKIEEVLVQQRMEQLQSAWIANLRNESKIQMALTDSKGSQQRRRGRARQQ